MKPPRTQLRGKGVRGSGDPQTYRILKFVGDFFGLDPVLSTVNSILDPSYEIWR
jgi:hypothetical protein